MSAAAQVPLFQPPLAADEPAPKPFELDIIGSIDAGPDSMNLTRLRSVLAGAAADAKEMKIVLHGPGGNVFEGFAMYAELDLHPAEKTVEIRGLAASIHSVIAMAAAPGKIKIHRLGRIMIHEARAGIFGTKAEAREMGDLLESLDRGIVDAYSKHFNWDAEKILAAMEAQSGGVGGTWLNAEEAHAAGAVSEIMDGADAVNRLDLSPLAAFGIPKDVRELYDAALETPQPPAASLAGELLDFFQHQTPAPPEARPSVELLAAVNDRLTELRSTAS